MQHAQSSVACHRGADLRNLALGFYAFSPALELFSISNFNFNSPAGYSGVCSGNIYSATSYLHQKRISLSFLVSVQYKIYFFIPLSYFTTFLLWVFCSLSDWQLFFACIVDFVDVLTVWQRPRLPRAIIC